MWLPPCSTVPGPDFGILTDDAMRADVGRRVNLRGGIHHGGGMNARGEGALGKKERQHAGKADARVGHANERLAGRGERAVDENGGGGALFGFLEKGSAFSAKVRSPSWAVVARQKPVSWSDLSPMTSPSNSLAISAVVNICVCVFNLEFLQVAD